MARKDNNMPHKFNKIQRASEGFKHGEGTPHGKAKDRLICILGFNGWFVYPDAIFQCAFYLRNKEGSTLKSNTKKHAMGYYHEFDIYANKLHSNGLTSELIVEIDGKSHDSEVQQGKDKTAEEYAAFFLPDARLVRMDIGILLNHAISDNAILEMYGIR
jgi:hypothetical protein